MEFRKEITDCLKQGLSWKEIAERIDLREEELTSIACSLATYSSGTEPKFQVGDRVLFFVDEEENYFGKIVRILDKRGELYPEFEYIIQWNDGLEEVLWEQQVINYRSDFLNNQWLL